MSHPRFHPSGHLFAMARPKGTQSMSARVAVIGCGNVGLGAADLGNIRMATRSIAGSLNGTNPVIVNKSTSPIGTGETIEEILTRALEERSRLPRIVSNPEFLRQGHVVEDFFQPDQIVVGSRRREDAEAVARLYDGLDTPVLLTDLRTAEMIKYVSNTFLATKISFMNEISRL